MLASSIATATATVIPTMELQRKIATLGIFSDIIRNLCSTTAAAFVRQMQQICTFVAAFILHAKRIQIIDDHTHFVHHFYGSGVIFLDSLVGIMDEAHSPRVVIGRACL